MKKDSKTIHEAFSRFFEQPKRETLRDLLKENLGELRNCDFKESWPDHASLSKHVLGLANSGGGCLVIGVKENPDKSASPVGLPEITDKADIFNGIKHFFSDGLLAAIEVADFSYAASEYPVLVGKRFQVLFVHPIPDLIPFVSRRGGNGIRAAAIYVRKEGITEEASYEEIQRMLIERLAASPQSSEAQSIKEHLAELKVLYSEIPRHFPGAMPILGSLHNIGMLANLFGPSKPNPDYPQEDYDAFVLRLLNQKKLLIEKLLGLKNA